MIEAKIEKYGEGNRYKVDLTQEGTAMDAILETVVLTRAVVTVFPERYLGRAIIRGISAGLEAILQEFDEPEVDDG